MSNYETTEGLNSFVKILLMIFEFPLQGTHLKVHDITSYIYPTTQIMQQFNKIYKVTDLLHIQRRYFLFDFQLHCCSLFLTIEISIHKSISIIEMQKKEYYFIAEFVVCMW